MSEVADRNAAGPDEPRRAGWRKLLDLLSGDLFALVAAVYLLLLLVVAVFGPEAYAEYTTGINLRQRNMPPGSVEHGWIYVLGADTLGRSILARLIVASRLTIAIAGSAVLISMVVGTGLGLVAGYYGGRMGTLIMRGADIIMSFPSLLMAVIVLYVLEPLAANVVLVLAVTRTPVYIRVTRAEVLEIRERLFVEAARAMGAGDLRIVVRNITPVVAPTVLTVATLDFANVMLAESSLSFLGIGVQPPSITWGLMVAQGRNYLSTAWWLAFWPGVAIMLATLASNLLSNWLRIASDPALRWRLETAATTDSTQGG